MNLEQALALVSDVFLEKAARSLTEAERAILSGAWNELSYDEIANASGYSVSYLQRDVGPKFWKLLSQAFDRKLNKTNARGILQQEMNRRAEESGESGGVREVEEGGKAAEGREIRRYGDFNSKFKTLPLPPTPHLHIDWGEAIDIAIFYGRTEELNTLKHWILQDRCHLVALLGMGGIGKSSLAAKITHQLQTQFEFVIWRSLRCAPPLDKLLSELVLFLSNQQDMQATIDRVLHWLRTHRCLVILDNVETILQAGDRAGHYQPDYEDYGDLFRLLGESFHQSCVILTSREKPAEVGMLEGDDGWVRSLHLSGSWEASLALINSKGLVGTDAEKRQLCEFYNCSPLALKIVASSIQSLFEGEITAFLKQETLVFNGMRRLLDQQFERLTYLEHTIMFWLAINREWTTIAELADDIVPTVSRASLLESLESLSWRSLIERKSGRYTQQPVVMEYFTNQLIEKVATELVTLNLSVCNRYSLLKTTVADYIRDSQSRLILQPLAERLRAQFCDDEALGQHLQKILQTMRNNPISFFAYGVGNFINFCLYLQIRHHRK